VTTNAQLPAAGATDVSLGSITFPNAFGVAPACGLAIFNIAILIASSPVNFRIEQAAACSAAGMTVKGSVASSTEISVLGVTWAANLIPGIFIGDSTILDAALPNAKGTDTITVTYAFGAIDATKNPKICYFLRGAIMVKDGSDKYGFLLTLTNNPGASSFTFELKTD
jgi:hypothetical protein